MSRFGRRVLVLSLRVVTIGPPIMALRAAWSIVARRLVVPFVVIWLVDTLLIVPLIAMPLSDVSAPNVRMIRLAAPLMWIPIMTRAFLRLE